MSEYIDKDALMETLKNAHKRLIETIGYTRHTIGFEGAMDYVEDALSADVVEVVRCKDCKYWHDWHCAEPVISPWEGRTNKSARSMNDYCSYGISKGGDKE